MPIRLRYGNTNTYYVPGSDGGILVDTDYAGTLPSFFGQPGRRGSGSNRSRGCSPPTTIRTIWESRGICRSLG